MEKKVGGEFLNEILRDQDLAFVIGFDVNVNLLQDFTNSVDVLETALNSARIDITGGGQLALLAGRHRSRRSPRHAAL